MEAGWILMPVVGVVVHGGCHGIPPVAVLYMHVHLAGLGLAGHVVLVHVGAHAVLADGGPGAHHRLALLSASAGLGIEHGAITVARSAVGAFGQLVGIAPHTAHGRPVGGEHAHVAGSVGRQGAVVVGDAHRVVLDSLAVDARHVGRAYELLALVVGVIPVADGELIVHPVVLHMRLTGGVLALEVVVIEDAVIGGRLTGLLPRLERSRRAHRGGVHRTHQHAVVPHFRFVVAEHVGPDVHLQLVAAHLVGVGEPVHIHRIGVGRVLGRAVAVTTVPLAQSLAHRHADDPGLRGVAVRLALMARVARLGFHQLVQAAGIGAVLGTAGHVLTRHIVASLGRHVGVGAGLGIARGRAACTAQVGILHGGGSVVASVLAVGRLEHLHLHEVVGNSLEFRRRIGVGSKIAGNGGGLGQQLGRHLLLHELRGDIQVGQVGAVVGLLDLGLDAARHDVGELHAVQIAIAVVVGGQAAREVLVVLERGVVLVALDAAVVPFHLGPAVPSPQIVFVPSDVGVLA